MDNNIYATIKELSFDGFVAKAEVARFILANGGVKVFLWFSGCQFWYLNGQRHRGGNKPAIIYAK